MANAIQALLAVGVLLSSSQAPRQQVSAEARQRERNKDVVRRFFEKQNHGDARGSSEEWAETAANNGQPIPGDARRVFQTAIEDLRRTFPDWHVGIVDLAAEGDSIVALCRVTGTPRHWPAAVERPSADGPGAHRQTVRRGAYPLVHRPWREARRPPRHS
jgi:hypothetical protein